MCGEVEQSERIKEKIQEDVNKLKQQFALRKHKTAEEERSMSFFIGFTAIKRAILIDCGVLQLSILQCTVKWIKLFVACSASLYRMTHNKLVPLVLKV